MMQSVLPELQKSLTLDLGDLNACDAITINHDRSYIYTLVLFTDTDIGHDTIVHELHHLVFYILDSIGMKLTHDTMEAYAYLQCYLDRSIVSLVQHHLLSCRRKSKK